MSIVITLLPVFIGLFLWNQLPDSHLVCVVATNIDPKSKDINKKIFRVLLWICPLVSLFVSTVIYGYSLGYDFDMSYLCGILIGVLYLVLGNFLPTVKPNYTIGFRIPWTLNDPDNWSHHCKTCGYCLPLQSFPAFCQRSILICITANPDSLPLYMNILMQPQEL